MAAGRDTGLAARDARTDRQVLRWRRAERVEQETAVHDGDAKALTLAREHDRGQRLLRPHGLPVDRSKLASADPDGNVALVAQARGHAAVGLPLGPPLRGPHHLGRGHADGQAQSQRHTHLAGDARLGRHRCRRQLAQPEAMAPSRCKGTSRHRPTDPACMIAGSTPRLTTVTLARSLACFR